MLLAGLQVLSTSDLAQTVEGPLIFLCQWWSSNSLQRGSPPLHKSCPEPLVLTAMQICAASVGTMKLAAGATRLPSFQSGMNLGYSTQTPWLELCLLGGAKQRPYKLVPICKNMAELGPENLKFFIVAPDQVMVECLAFIICQWL